MKTSNLIKNTLLLSLSALCTLVLFSSCSTDNSDKTPQEKSKEQILTHPGQNLTDKVNTFKLGDKDFTLSEDSEAFQNIFGEQSTIWYSKDIVEKNNKETGEDVEYQNMILSYIVQDGVYCGDAAFYETDDSGKNILLSFNTVFDYGDKEMHDKATNISYTENGEVKRKDFPIEVDKILFSIDNLTTGTATREQLEQYLGEGKYDPPTEDYDYSREVFAFEDFTLVTYFDNNDIFKAVYIFNSDYNDYMSEYFKSPDNPIKSFLDFIDKFF